MLVRTLDDLAPGLGEIRTASWSSRRLLPKNDGMGVTLTDAVLDAGLDQVWWQKTTSRRCTASKAKQFLRISARASPTRSKQEPHTRSTSTVVLVARALGLNDDRRGCIEDKAFQVWT